MSPRPAGRFVLLAIAAISVALQARAQSPPENQFAQRVSQANLLRNVRSLVAIGNRFGGSRSGDSAAAWVAARFRSARLAPELFEDDEVLTFHTRRWTLKAAEPRRLRKSLANAWLSPYSPSSQRTRSRLVYVDDESWPEGREIDSAVVLTPMEIDARTYSRLVRHGAAAILSYAPAMPGYYSDWAMISSLPAREENTIPMYNVSYNGGRALAKALAESTSIIVEFSSETEVSLGRPKTVEASIEGESGRYILVCAHGDADSGGPGADDNASGVSGVLEIARVLNGMIRDRTLERPRYGIRFVIWGKEYHSAFGYVIRHREELDSIAAVINFDEIGAGQTRDCLYVESNDVPHNEKLLRTLEQVGLDYAGRRGYWKEFTTNPSQGGTDSYVFLPDGLSQLDVPAVEIPSTTVFTAAWNTPRAMAQTEGWRSPAWTGHPDSVVIDYSAYYHSSLDVPALTTEREPHNMVWAVRAAGIALLRMAWD